MQTFERDIHAALVAFNARLMEGKAMVQMPDRGSSRSLAMSYVWAFVILAALGGCFILGILFLRPAADPLVVISGVVVAATTIGASVMGFLKAQETHASVNGRMSELIATNVVAAHAQGVALGTQNEQARIAAMLAIANATSSVPKVDPSTIKAADVQIDATTVNVEKKGVP